LKFSSTPDEIAGPTWADYRRDLMRRAQEGDVAAAGELVEIVTVLLSASKPLPNDLRDYVVRALMRVLRGDDAGRALNLVRRQGRQRTPTDEDAAVVALVELKMRKLRPGPCSPNVDDSALLPKAKDEAVQTILDAGRRNVDIRRIEQILKTYNEEIGHADPIKSMSDDLLEALADMAVHTAE
jgi:hypothetical protein